MTDYLRCDDCLAPLPEPADFCPDCAAHDDEWHETWDDECAAKWAAETAAWAAEWKGKR